MLAKLPDDVRRAVVEARSAALSRELRIADGSSFGARLGHGISIPWKLFRVGIEDPAIRRRYMKVCGLQTLAVLSLFALFYKRAPEVGPEGYHWGLAGGDVHFQLANAHSVLAQMYGTLCIIEWCVIALSRQFHDAIGRDLALRAGDEPEDPERAPRIKLDIRWMWRKLQRRFRGMRAMFVCGVALAWISLIPAIGNILFTVSLSAVGFYWLVVSAAAKTRFAWQSEADPLATDVRFVHGLEQVVAKLSTRWLGWLPRLVRWGTKRLFPPARIVDAQPGEFLGLGIVRALSVVPVLYLFVRPLMPVAAAHLVLERRTATMGSDSVLAPTSLGDES